MTPERRIIGSLLIAIAAVSGCWLLADLLIRWWPQ